MPAPYESWRDQADLLCLVMLVTQPSPYRDACATDPRRLRNGLTAILVTNHT